MSTEDGRLTRTRFAWVPWVAGEFLLGLATLWVLLVSLLQWAIGQWQLGQWVPVVIAVIMMVLLLAIVARLSRPQRRLIHLLIMVTTVGAGAWILNDFGFSLPGLLGG